MTRRVARRRGQSRKSARIDGAFTLIELLVVIAIIAVVISILVPSLGAAREHGRAVKCAANLHHVGQAMGSYLTDNLGMYPPAYIYPLDGSGNYDLEDQPIDHPNGYLHWSYFLYSRGQAPQEAFSCPSMVNGGAPRTNPGSQGWESGQSDRFGASGPPSQVEDKQAIRMAYTGNAAIFPRNKFTRLLSGGVRVNVCVNESQIHDTGRTILATEFNDNWKAISVVEGGGLLCKSHRPVNPFGHVASGSDEYAAPEAAPGFSYGDPPTFGLQSVRTILEGIEMFENPAIMETNAVGRHHRGGDGSTLGGGTVNFLYADGHIEKKSVLTTLMNHEWGNRYYAISGHNKVGPPWND